MQSLIKRKILVLSLSLAMIFQMGVPVAFAADVTPSETKTITKFEELSTEVVNHTVPLGTEEGSILEKLPQTLSAMVEKKAAKAAQAATTPGDTLDVFSIGENNGVSTAEPITEITTEGVSLSVTWESDKTFSTEKPDTYNYTAKLTDEGYTLAEGVEMPKVKVAVEVPKATVMTLANGAVANNLTSSNVNGTISYWNSGKGFGFIKDSDGKDYFFYYTSIQDSIEDSNKYHEGTTVSFIPYLDSKNNLNAQNVSIVNEGVSLASSLSVSGNLAVGNTLTSTLSNSFYEQNFTVNYQWYQTDTADAELNETNDITDATNSSYVLTESDKDKYISVKVSYAVNDLNPTITTAVKQVGQVKAETVTTDVASVTIDSNTTNYATFAEALSAIENSNTSKLQLLANASSDEFTVAKGKNISIDLNSFTLTCNKITVESGATLNMSDSSGNNAGSLIGAIITDGELNITGGTYYYNSSEKNYMGFYFCTIVAQQNSTGKISGGIFKRSSNDDNKYVSLNYEPTSKVALNGGTFDMIDVINFNTADKLPKGYCLTNKDNGSYMDYPFCQRVFNVTVIKCKNHLYERGICKYCKSEDPNYSGLAEVTINDKTTKYFTLAEASSAANGNTATIKLLEDVVEDNLTLSSGTIVLDLGGHTIRSNNTILNIAETANVTIKNGALNGYDRGNTISVEGGSLVLHSDVTIYSYANYNCGLSMSGGAVTIDGSSFKDGYRSVEVYGGTLAVNSGSFEGLVYVNWNSENLTVALKGGVYAAKRDCGEDDTYDGIQITKGRPLSSLLADGYAYRFRSGDKAWMTTADLADKTVLSNVTVEQAPVKITQASASRTIYYGYNNETLSVTANALDTSKPITYQWYSVGTGADEAIENATTNSFIIPQGKALGEYKYYCEVTCDGYTLKTKTATVTVAKSGTTFNDTLKSYKDEGETTTFTYGDTITVKATPKATGTPATMMVRSFSEPQADQMALFIGNKQISEPVTAGVGGVYTMTYNTADKDLAIGSNTITAKYVGNANMADFSANVEVTLNAKTLTDTMIGDISSQTYTGSAITPVLTVKDGTTTLTANTDYTVAYSNNKDVGIATVTITGKGNYSGKITKTFEIKKAVAPTITFPIAAVITYGQKLSESTFIGGSTEYGTFAWADGTIVPTIGNSGYTVNFTANENTVKNYEAITTTTQTVAVTVNQATPTVNVEASISGETGTRIATLTATVTGVTGGVAPTGTVKFVNFTSGSDVDITSVSIVNGVTTYKWSGLADQIYKVKAVYSGDTNYTGNTSEEIFVDTAKKPQENFALTKIGAKTYGDNITLKATGGNGTGAVSYESSDADVIKIEGTTATILKVGTATITATKAGDDGYNQATASESVTVAKKAIVAKPNSFSIKSNEKMPTLAWSIEGLVGNDRIEATNKDAVKMEMQENGTKLEAIKVGTFDIVFTVAPTFAEQENYTIITGKGSLNITQYSSGGSSSGGGGGTWTPSNPTVTTPSTTTENPKPTTEVTTTVKPTVSNGTVNVTVSSDTVNSTIAKAQAEAKKNGTTENGIVVEIKVDTKNTTANNISANLPKQSIDALVKANTKEVRITSEVVDINLNLDALKEIQKQVDSDINVTAKKMDNNTLSAETQKIVGNRPVYDFTITGANDKKVTDFGNGKVSVSIPYTLGANENATNVVAYYIDGSGKVQEMPNSVYNPVTKTLSFVTNHFSKFAVGYKNASVSFTDTANHWAKDSIEFVAARGILAGTGNNKFFPNTSMTRGMFATALGRLAEADVSKYTKSSFSDVKADAYYAPFVEWASKNGIVNGIGDGKFAPDQSITREQMAVIMVNYAKAIGFELPKVHAENTFADNAKIGSYATGAVKQMQMAGILSGKNGNKFDPQGTSTRAEVSAVLKRFVELL